MIAPEDLRHLPYSLREFVSHAIDPLPGRRIMARCPAVLMKHLHGSIDVLEDPKDGDEAPLIFYNPWSGMLWRTTIYDLEDIPL